MIQLPALVRDAVQKVRPSLVTIESFAGVTTRDGEISGIRKQGEGNTTGIVVRSDGLVLTSRFNSIERSRVITVLTADGERRRASVHAQDLTRNLCLLKLDDSVDLPVPQWVAPDQRQVGRYAISAGVGYGDTQPAISVGIISAHNRIFGRALQTDANISPANYGGPLLNIEGQIYGICVPLSPQGMSAAAGNEWYDSGIGFVIPLGTDATWLETLIAGESIYPGSLGLTVSDTESGQGLQVQQVLDGFPAQGAGIGKDHILWSADGQRLSRQADLLGLIRRKVAGQTVNLVFFSPESPDQRTEAEVELARHPDSLPKSQIPGLPPLEELR